MLLFLCVLCVSVVKKKTFVVLLILLKHAEMNAPYIIMRGRLDEPHVVRHEH
jgi:hypothetical protein